MLTALKQEAEHSWLRVATSQVLQQKLIDLERAFVNFWAGRARYPRFKSKHHQQSIRYPQGIKVNPDSRRTYLPKVGWVRTIFHRQLQGQLKNVTVSKTKSGRYYAAIQVEAEIPEPAFQGDANGLDLGLGVFAALADGRQVANPRHLVRAQRRLARGQRCLARKRRGSRGWETQRLRVARQHEKVANQRADFQHKLSRELVEAHGLLALEDLHVKGMLRNRRLAKHIADAGWGSFVRMLIYKGAWYGCRVVWVDRWYPSSKRCSGCGAELAALPLHIRWWTCPQCGERHNRDVNAARNLLKQATVGTTGSHADGVYVRPVKPQAGTSKSETPQLAAG
jgi:putative transposase